MHLNSKTRRVESQGPGIVAYENMCYTAPIGRAMMRMRYLETKADICDNGVRDFSDDNGATWHEEQPYVMGEVTTGGTIRRQEFAGYIDAEQGAMVSLEIEGLLAGDDCLDGMTSYRLKYKVSVDGGKSFVVNDTVMQRGAAYTPQHPIDGVWVGKNCIMRGAESSLLRSPAGHLVMAAMITPLGPDGEYYNPTGGYTYHEVVVLLGRWQPDLRIEWELVQRLNLGVDQSTRGVFEPTLGLAPDGRLLMLARGSNDTNHELPGRKWASVSEDGGRTWSAFEPWTYSDGGEMFSPSSINQLVPHSNGRLYWLGNIRPDNPFGNEPRHPLFVGEVDLKTFKLIRESVAVIDDIDPQGDPFQSLSNFLAYEDRESGELVVHMSPYCVDAAGTVHGDSYLYRVAVGEG